LIEGTPPNGVVPARLGMSHVSIQAGDGPVFRLVGAAATIRLDDSVIAPPFDTGATLVACDAPDRLNWLGRGNLYAAITTYLQPDGGFPGTQPIRGLANWAESAGELREVDSTERDTTIWEEADPATALARQDPTSAFALSSVDRFPGQPGTRRGPFGPVAGGGGAASPSIAALSPGQAPSRERVRSTREPGTLAPASPAASATAAATGPAGSGADQVRPSAGQSSIEADATPPMIAPMERPGDDTTPPSIAPMERPIGADRGESATKSSSPESSGVTAPPGEPSNAPAANSAEAAKRTDAPSAVRTPDQLLRFLRDPESQGGTVVLAPGAEIDLPTCVIKQRGRIVVQAAEEPNGKRPRIRFRPAAEDVKSGVRWPVLFRVESGALELQGIDIVLDSADVPPSGRWAAFGTWAGSDLNLVRCTVTVEGDHPRSAVVAVQATENDIENGLFNPDPSAASIRASNSLLRCGGDVVDVSAGRRLDLGLTNVVISCAGCLVHGHGLPRGQTAEPIRLNLRQVTARAFGGLVYLESAIGEPELPVAEVTVRDAVLATTNEDAPLCRVDGQEDLDLLQDRIRWEGHAVAYHKIDVYRRDQTALPGNVPRRFDRASWDIAVGAREDAAVHGELPFVHAPNDRQEPWTLKPDDVRLDTRSTKTAIGAELSQIPEPPPGN
jgi:hypothetical protein